MLVNKKYNTSDIVSLKLSNGDEVIGKVVEDSQDEYLLYKPLIAIFDGERVRFFPIMFTVDGEKNLPISKSNVMVHGLAHDKAKTGYIETTTGIQTVSKGSLIV